MELNAFTRAYIEAALWSSTNDDGEPLDDQYSMSNIAPESLARMVADCTDFEAANAELLANAGDDAQNGIDFWLTRNRHGAGFWDRGYPAEIGRTLTDMAHGYGSCDLYIGDDGLIHAA